LVSTASSELDTLPALSAQPSFFFRLGDAEGCSSNGSTPSNQRHHDGRLTITVPILSFSMSVLPG